MTHIKIAATTYRVHDLVRNRWSARAFSDTPITPDELNTIFEAASWAASANNEQPWHYSYAVKGTPGFETIWNALVQGNQPWAKHAAVLIVASARHQFEANHQENPWARHDLGMANATLFLQATALNIHGHAMAGFHKEQLVADLALSPLLDPVCVIALGYLADAETLDEPYKTREKTARHRKAVAEFTTPL